MFKLFLTATMVCTLSIASIQDTLAKSVIAKPTQTTPVGHTKVYNKPKEVKSKVIKSNSRVSPPKAMLDKYIKRKCGKNCIDVNALNLAITKAADEFGVPPNLILSIIKVESGFNMLAHSSKSVSGLMQVSWHYHQPYFKGKGRFNPEGNIAAGTYVIKSCLDRNKGAINKALECYNAGGDPLYVVKVRKALTEIKSLA